MRLILASLLALLPLNVQAQEQEDPTKLLMVTQVCVPLEIAFTTSFRYGETVLFTGNGTQMATQTGEFYEGGMFFLVNQQTGTWSMIYTYEDGTSCLVGNGKGFSPYSQ